MSIKDKKKASGGLHLMLKADESVHIENSGEKLKMIYHGIDELGFAAFSFVGPRSFTIAREKLLDKIGIAHD